MSAQLALSTDQVTAASRTAFVPTPWSTPVGDDLSDWTRGLRPGGTVLNFTGDREIYGEGDSADMFFKVVSGVVRTCKFLADGRRQIDAFYVAGDLFGFEAGSEHRLSAEAVCDCTVIAYRRRGLDTLAAADQGVSQQLFSYAMHSLARAQEHSLLLGRRNALEKVAAFLVEWAEQSAGEDMVTLAMTRQDIADYLGLTIETVSRTLSQLERDDIIALPSARQILLKNPAALDDLNA